MSQPPPVPLRSEAADLVVFDVDGTLHDTFRWWSEVLANGLDAFDAEYDVVCERPDRARADSIVGLKDEQVWGAFLPEHLRGTGAWERMREIVIPMEVERLFSGEDFLYPGVRSLLARLRAAGTGLAIASNCRGEYFDAVCRGQALGPAVDWHFCLDSPGITDKTSMVATAIDRARAVRPVMVGDREPDLEAARAVGLPFIWRANPRCDLASDSDAVWDGDPETFATLVGPLGNV